MSTPRRLDANGRTRTPSMADVATHAGVSAQTVSRVLSGHPNVQSATRDRVLASVGALGYRMNNAARSLSSGRTRTIGVVVLPTVDYSGSALTHGVESAARRAGYAVNIATASSLAPAAIATAMTSLDRQSVEGIVLALPVPTGTDEVEAIARRIPTVTIDGSRTVSSEVVAIDQFEVGRLATEHLLELGHPTVWHIAGPDEWLDSTGRTAGWRAALEAAGREAPPMLHGDWSPESGYQAGLLLGRIPDATAVFIASDEMAFGAIRALHELGRRVPEDISVVGVDDIALAAYCSPALTTVAQPFGEIASIAVEHLIRRIDDPGAAPASATIAPQLVIRSSTGAYGR
ncbi:DNA-binding transcriptional regulator, LacI/PurR family [Agromyces sp. CF514]|uniref:LacI family DNA-binding transcriptional regulator n=1 Tax=Agromyces sp. CF514 TaxID=1881031 RepID=UPI0008ED4CD2|nr:LacI family DNA-binding transcriptional regulator [Agromyces sp. CF514]SFR68084.1 DNA-binding transcriptional regulator, LacI/PurR family [Agromyces sp. CF514]